MCTLHLNIRDFLCLFITYTVGIYSASINKSGRECTFIKTPGYVLHGNDNLIIRGISLRECQNYCGAQTEPECLSLEYAEKEICYMSANSNWTKPMDFTQSGHADYYENSCASHAKPPKVGADDAMVCPDDYFACTFNARICIPNNWRCDDFPDCDDESDELNCPFSDGQGWNEHVDGESDVFVCMSNGHKIQEGLVCDGKQDCSDNSDEDDCGDMAAPATCSGEEMQCGDDTNCILKTWVCDGEEDCLNGYDESSCEAEEEDIEVDLPCEYYCGKNGRGRCIPEDFVCDGERDCGNGRDESQCTAPTTACNPRIHFMCTDNGEPACIPKFFVCDGTDDCSQGSDEDNCHGDLTCLSTQFQCANKRECEFLAWVCDGDPDCEDGSDEINCSAKNCSAKFQFTCESDGLCIPIFWRCDQQNDCMDGSDEKNCESRILCNSDSEFTCKRSQMCVINEYVCDGDKDCSDGSDEETCNGECEWSAEVACKSDGKCITKEWVCDGEEDCTDGSDERDCPK